MIDGIYEIKFRGYADWGSGVLLLQRGVIAGADVGGVTYDGSFQEKTDAIDIRLTLIVPPGGTLVMGTPPQPKEFQFEIASSIPKRNIESGEYVTLETEFGPVNVVFRKLRDLPP